MLFKESKGLYISVLSEKKISKTNDFNPLILGRKYYFENIYSDSLKTNDFFLKNLPKEIIYVDKVIRTFNIDTTEYPINQKIPLDSLLDKYHMLRQNEGYYYPTVRTLNSIIVLDPKYNKLYYYSDEILGTYISKKVKSKKGRIRKNDMVSY
jgi:hypothetical protein